jgi:thiol-disulfide isomerase/thioredoxin
MNNLRTFAAFTLFAALPHLAPAQKTPRHWIGTATVSGQSVPVQLDLTPQAKTGTITGTFLNGPERRSSSNGSLTGSHLVLRFNSFARTLEGDIHDGKLTAVYSGARLKQPIALELHADRDGKPASTFVAASKAAGDAKGTTINGDWEIYLPAKSAKGESAWTLRVAPYEGNGEIRAVILRIDGDTGGLYGRYDQAAGEYRVSRFADSGGSILSLKPEPDGTLAVSDLKTGDHWSAKRPGEARKENLGKPTLATEQTTVNNPAEPLRFVGPNLAGTTINSTDPDFKGKVVIVAIGGSWCPNCHDEAPLLVELYNKYHQRGLEVVSLSFEEDDQLKNPERLRAFVSQYKIPYPVLVMGTPDELNDKLPQGKNLNCWPTSFFVGRDGLVKETHAGFSGPATGTAYTDLRSETFALVEKLLAAYQTASLQQ